MIWERMGTISMASGNWEIRINLSNLGFIPALLDTLQLMGQCVAVGIIAFGTLKSKRSTLALQSVYLLCTIEAPLSKISTALRAFIGPQPSSICPRPQLKQHSYKSLSRSICS